jgi:hypothetical protein
MLVADLEVLCGNSPTRMGRRVVKTFTVRPAGPSNVYRESSKAIPCSETEAVSRKRISTAIGYQPLLVLADFQLFSPSCRLGT